MKIVKVSIDYIYDNSTNYLRGYKVEYVKSFDILAQSEEVYILKNGSLGKLIELKRENIDRDGFEKIKGDYVYLDIDKIALEDYKEKDFIEAAEEAIVSIDKNIDDLLNVKTNLKSEIEKMTN